MKFSCYKNDLTEALQFAIRAVAVKPMTPILAGIYLRADGSMLEIQANNFSTGIITRIPVNTESPGEVVVSGKRFQEFVRNMPDDTITFSDVDNMLVIESGGASVELLTMQASDFPKVKTPDTDHSFKIRTTALKMMRARFLRAVVLMSRAIQFRLSPRMVIGLRSLKNNSPTPTKIVVLSCPLMLCAESCCALTLTTLKIT